MALPPEIYEHTWTTQEVCYLQDLCVDATARGAGSAAGCSRRPPRRPETGAATGSTGRRRKTMPTRAPFTTGSPVSAASSVTITRWNNPRCYAQRYTQGKRVCAADSASVKPQETFCIRAAAARPRARTAIITARRDVIQILPRGDRAEQARRSVASSAACTYSRKNL